MSRVRYESVEGGLRCQRHGVTFGATESCEQCDAARAAARAKPAPPDRFVKPKAPKGCVSVETHEREFTAMAKYCEDLAETLASGKEFDGSTVVKLLDASIKARRAASSIARAREEDAFVASLEKKRADTKKQKRGRH